MAILEESSDSDGERLLTRIALVKADSGSFAVQLPDLLFVAAMGANRTIRPKQCLDKSECGFFVVKLRFGKY
jgi:hypothetical protein